MSGPSVEFNCRPSRLSKQKQKKRRLDVTAVVSTAVSGATVNETAVAGMGTNTPRSINVSGDFAAQVWESIRVGIEEYFQIKEENRQLKEELEDVKKQRDNSSERRRQEVEKLTRANVKHEVKHETEIKLEPKH